MKSKSKSKKKQIQNRNTKKNNRKKREEYDIIILGGGIAGIYTLYQLIKNPHFSQKRILLLEKSERLGGRIYSTNPYKEHPEDVIEAGAGRFSQKHILLHELIKELNLENKIEKTTSKSEYYPINPETNIDFIPSNILSNKNILQPLITLKNSIRSADNSSTKLPVTYLNEAPLWGADSNLHWYKNIILYDKPKITELILKVIIYSKLENPDYLRSVSFVEYAKGILTKEEIQQIQDGFGYYSELVIMNTYDAIHLMENLNPDNDFYILNGGLTQINERMIDFVIKTQKKNPFKINQKVMNIRQLFSQNKEDNEKYEIQTQNKKYITEIIICALPKNVLEKISFFKPVYPFLSKIKCSPLCRIYSRFSTTALEPQNKIWFNNLPKLTTNNHLRIVIPINKEKGIIMISYTDNKFADYWYKIYKKDGIKILNEKLKEEIEQSTGIIIPREPLQTNIYYWGCGVGYWGIGANSKEISQKMIQPFLNEMKKNETKRNIYCCGEHYSEKNQQWIEGALETSKKVLEKIMYNVEE
jgi:monoamine oxidase